MHRQRNTRLRPRDEVVPGVIWGRPEWVPSPAYWAALVSQEGPQADAYISDPGAPLVEDVAFCMLGGYGIRMEVNRAAWERLKSERVFDCENRADAKKIEALLAKPLTVGGKPIRYRFPRQRASRLAFALNHLWSNPPPIENAYDFRKALMALPGIGPKTASWIARNWLGSDSVAILDVHVLRAGRIIGLFSPDYRLPRDYTKLEKRFLEFAAALGVRPSLLDAVIWREMRALGSS